MKTEYKVGDRIRHIEHGPRVWIIEIIKAPGVYCIGTKTEFIDMVPESHLISDDKEYNSVREHRLELKMTLKKLSDKTGIPLSILSRIELGQPVRLYDARVISKTLRRSINKLWPK